MGGAISFWLLAFGGGTVRWLKPRVARAEG